MDSCYQLISFVEDQKGKFEMGERSIKSTQLEGCVAIAGREWIVAQQAEYGARQEEEYRTDTEVGACG